MAGDYLELFFPSLKRRPEYIGKGTEVKSKYSDYRVEIQEDCQNRCVYCDILLAEHGFEGMQLDHFRPQKIFPYLADDPINLLLACPKCNRLKWYHWPCEKDKDAHPYDGSNGFINPFDENRFDYLVVKPSGEIEEKQPPLKYMIKLLELNRNSRIQVRRRRIILNEISLLFNVCNENFRRLIDDMRGKIISPEEAADKMQFWQDKTETVQEMFEKVLTNNFE